MFPNGIISLSIQSFSGLDISAERETNNEGAVDLRCKKQAKEAHFSLTSHQEREREKMIGI